MPRFASLRIGFLEAHLASRPGLPEVSLRLILEAGASAEPAPAAGLAELTGRLLTEGAGSRGAPEMAAWLDRLGAAFQVGVGYDFASVNMHFLSEVAEEAFEFLASAVRTPRFDPEEVDRVREERLDEIERDLDEPSFVADRLLIRGLYGDHRYGTPAAGVAETVAAVDRAAIVDFHRSHYGARDAALVVCGDLGLEELDAVVRPGFEAWSEGAGRTESDPGPTRATSAGRILLANRPGAAQAEIRVGAVGCAYDAPEHYACLVANAVLGGVFNSRLNLNLREDKGWTYGARSSFRFRRGRGPFVIRTAVETGVAAQALGEALGEIAGLRDRPPSAEELRLARRALTLSLPLQFETNRQVSRKVARRIGYALPTDYWETFRDRIEAVSADDVARVADRYLRRENLVLAVVGDAAAIRNGLERIAPVEERDPRSPAP